MGDQQIYQYFPSDQSNLFNNQYTTQTNSQSKSEIRALMPSQLSQNQNQFWANGNQQNQNYTAEQATVAPYQYQAQQTTTSHQATVTSQQQFSQSQQQQQVYQQPQQQIPKKTAEVEIQTDIRWFFALELPTVPNGTPLDTQHIKLTFVRDMMALYGQGQVKVQGNSMYVYY